MTARRRTRRRGATRSRSPPRRSIATAARPGPGRDAGADAAKMRVWETGTVKAVADGDTIWVDFAGDRSKKTYKVRLAGDPGHRDQAPGRARQQELVPRPARRQGAAQARPRQEGPAARGPEGQQGQGRPLRYVYVKSGGKWVDVQALHAQARRRS